MEYLKLEKPRVPGGIILRESSHDYPWRRYR